MLESPKTHCNLINRQASSPVKPSLLFRWKSNRHPVRHWWWTRSVDLLFAFQSFFKRGVHTGESWKRGAIARMAFIIFSTHFLIEVRMSFLTHSPALFPIHYQSQYHITGCFLQFSYLVLPILCFSIGYSYIFWVSDIPLFFWGSSLL